MDNILDLVKLLSNSQQKQEEKIIPKEITDQYPYGQFPLKYTKSGQETIRKQSENRFSYENTTKEQLSKNDSELNIATLLPLIQLMSGKNKQPKDMLKILSKLLFKDNPEMEKLFNLIPQIKPQEINNKESFPDTNKVAISNLKRIN